MVAKPRPVRAANLVLHVDSAASSHECIGSSYPFPEWFRELLEAAVIRTLPVPAAKGRL